MRRSLYYGIVVCLIALLVYWLSHPSQPKKAAEAVVTGGTTQEKPDEAPRMPQAAPKSASPEQASVDSTQDLTRTKQDDRPVIDQIRDAARTNPKHAESLARQDQELDPDSPDADERDALIVAAVFNQRHVDRAREEARIYFRKHPNGQFSEFLSKQVGVNPPPASTGN